MTPNERHQRLLLTKEYKDLHRQLGEVYDDTSAWQQDPKWIEYWERRGQFFRETSERILAQHRDEVFLNQCPKCGTLARTPRAKYCLECLFRWK